MEIKNSTIKDVESILKLYKEAIAYQNEKKGIPWQMLESEVVENEIQENRQWKLIIDNEIACVWVTTFDDVEIWRDKNSEPSVYLHRITTNAKFRGKNILSLVITWAKDFASKNNKTFLRLDTAGINPGLITAYVKNGFKFIATTTIETPHNLPTHYNNAPICLFEMNLSA